MYTIRIGGRFGSVCESKSCIPAYAGMRLVSEHLEKEVITHIARKMHNSWLDAPHERNAARLCMESASNGTEYAIRHTHTHYIRIFAYADGMMRVTRRTERMESVGASNVSVVRGGDVCWVELDRYQDNELLYRNRCWEIKRMQHQIFINIKKKTW